jgi:hypothetical protein
MTKKKHKKSKNKNLKRISHRNKRSYWGPSLTVLIAVLALIIAVLTFVENKNNRIATSKPVLMIQKSTPYYLSLQFINSIHLFPSFDLNFRQYKDSINNNSIRKSINNDLEINMVNVGNGTATNINLNFEYNKNLYVDKINSLLELKNSVLKGSLQKIRLDIFGIHGLFINEKIFGDTPFENVIPSPTIETSSKNFLVTNNKSFEPLKFRIPTRYINLYSLHKYLIFHLMNNKILDPSLVNKYKIDDELLIKVKYYDINHEVHTQTFLLKFKHFSGGNSTDPQTRHYQEGFINITSIE